MKKPVSHPHLVLLQGSTLPTAKPPEQEGGSFWLGWWLECAACIAMIALCITFGIEVLCW